ncbi:MAG: hypothetical protein M1820_003116 [Bogoriella megaspora]|nr:MAG: hypothetical protein M1820_003116 [Bogoriella megaspora]
MADPLSIAASIAGLLSLAGVIIPQGYALCSKLKNRSEDVKLLMTETVSFSGLLHGVRAHLIAEHDRTERQLNFLPDESFASLNEAVQDCEKLLVEIQDLLHKVSNQRTARLLTNMKFLTDGVEQLTSRMERYKTLFILTFELHGDLRAAETEKLAHDILTSLGQIRAGQDRLSNQLQIKEQNKKKSKLLDWLGQTTEAEHQDASICRDTQSGTWLLERVEFNTWLTAPGSSFLWLDGIPGSGKTVLVSTVIRTLQQIYKEGVEQNEIGLAYHYFRFSSECSLSSENVIGTLISQLLRQDPDSEVLTSDGFCLFERHESKRSYPSYIELKDMLHKLANRFSTIFIIVDALDEFAYRDKIIIFLQDLAAEEWGCEFKIFVASRQEIDLVQALAYFRKLTITSVEVASDIERYVRSRVARFRWHDMADLDAIVQQLCTRADGMFLWVVCQLDNLARIRTSVDLAMLKALPRGLDKTYYATLSKLETEDQILARRILQMVMYSSKPLDILELVEGIAIEPGIRSLKSLQQNKLLKVTDVFEICGSLIRQSQTTEKFSLAHYSVYEFLVSSKLESGEKNRFQVLNHDASLDLAMSCITYLNMEDFSSKKLSGYHEAISASDLRSEGTLVTESPFLDYAASYWWLHLATIDPKSYSALRPQLNQFFNTSRGNFDYWASVVRYTQGEYKYPFGLRPLHVASLHGLKNLTLDILESDPECVNSGTSDGRTALHVAIENGQDDLTELLINANARLEAADSAKRQPLHLATEIGNERAIRQLITAGADVNAALADGQTPLTMAMENKADELVELMLENADLGSSLSDGRSLMHLAAQTGNESCILRILQTKEKSLNMKDAAGWTPLHFACENGHQSVVEVLLDKGAITFPSDKNGWTPLHAAIKRQHAECAALLLQAKEVRSSVQSETSGQASSRLRFRPTTLEHDDFRKYGRNMFGSGSDKIKVPSPLFLAASDRFLEGVNLLLLYKDSSCDWGQHDIPMCLDVSYKQQDLTIFRVLLEHASMSDVHKILQQATSLGQGSVLAEIQPYLNNQDDTLTFHLREAVRLKEHAILDFLLQLPATDQPVPMIDLLAEAIGAQDLESVRLLSDSIHDMSMPDRNGTTPLHIAIRSGNYAIAALLMERGAYDSISTKTGETALHALAARRSTEEPHASGWIKLTHDLIEQGSDLFALDKSRQSMCHKAAASNNIPALTLALDSGVDPDRLDANNDTPVHLAIRHSHIEVLSLLLQHILVLDKERILQLLRGGKGIKNPENSLFVTAVDHFDELKLLLGFGKEALPSSEHDGIYHLGDLYNDACRSATARGYDEQVSLLLDAGASDHVDSSGQTLLHIAIYTKHENLLPIFFERNFRLDTPDASGDTALHQAIARNKDTAARQLIDRGAIVDVKAVELATETDQLELARLLSTKLPQGLDPNEQRRLRSSDLFQALRSEDCTKIIAILKDDRELLSATNSSSRTPLHVAATTGNPDVVEAVLSFKPDDKVINMKTPVGESALKVAIRAGFDENHQRIGELLLEAGADTQEAMVWAKTNNAFMWSARIKMIREIVEGRSKS